MYKPIELICDSCGKKFEKELRIYNKCKRKGYKHFVCSEVCKGNLRRTNNEYVKNKLRDESIKDEKGCWNWPKVDERGRCDGSISVNKIKVIPYKASYLAFIGEIADGLFVCHKCDNPACVNPEHLKSGTHQDNMDDMTNKDRQAKGIDIDSAKLTDGDVIEMRVLYKYYLDCKEHGIKCEKFTKTRLAEIYGVERPTASKAIRGITWKHIPV